MKYRVPVHVSMDLEVEISARKNADPAQLRAASEQLVERKMQTLFGPSSKFQGQGRVKASPTRSKDEQGHPVFRQPERRKPVPPQFGQQPDPVPENDPS